MGICLSVDFDFAGAGWKRAGRVSFVKTGAYIMGDRQ